MKKIFLIGTIAAIAFTSCMKKDHCEEPKEIEVCGTMDHKDDWGKDEYWDKDEDWSDEKDIMWEEEGKDWKKDEYDKDKKWEWKKKDWDDDCDPKPIMDK